MIFFIDNKGYYIVSTNVISTFVKEKRPISSILYSNKSYLIDSPLRKNEEVGVSRRIGISKNI
jgi:hypothetical protein